MKEPAFSYEELFAISMKWGIPRQVLWQHPVTTTILAFITPQLRIPFDFFLPSLLRHLDRVFNPSSFHLSLNRKGRTGFSGSVYGLENSLSHTDGNKQNYCKTAKFTSFPGSVMLVFIPRFLLGILEKARLCCCNLPVILEISHKPNDLV